MSRQPQPVPKPQAAPSVSRIAKALSKDGAQGHAFEKLLQTIEGVAMAKFMRGQVEEAERIRDGIEAIRSSIPRIAKWEEGDEDYLPNPLQAMTR